MNNQGQNSNQQPSRVMESDISEEAVKERRYLWMARAFALVSVLAVLTNLMLFSAIVSLSPLFRVQPFYLTLQDKNEQTLSVVRSDASSINQKNLAESFIRQYLLAYYTVGTDIPKLENTWGLGGLIDNESASSVFDAARDIFMQTIDRARQEGFTRGVRINVINQMVTKTKEQVETWKVGLKFSEMTRETPEPRISCREVEIRIRFLPRQEGVTWENRLRNPLGFQVVYMNTGMAECN